MLYGISANNNNKIMTSAVRINPLVEYIQLTFDNVYGHKVGNMFISAVAATFFYADLFKYNTHIFIKSYLQYACWLTFCRLDFCARCAWFSPQRLCMWTISFLHARTFRIDVCSAMNTYTINIYSFCTVLLLFACMFSFVTKHLHVVMSRNVWCAFIMSMLFRWVYFTTLRFVVVFVWAEIPLCLSHSLSLAFN